MNDTGHGGFTAGADVGGGAGNGARGGNAAKECRSNVAHALADELSVRMVAGAGHTVCHAGAQQGFNGSQQCNHKGGLHQLRQLCPVNLRQRRHGKPLRELTEAGADGFHRQVEHLAHQGAHQHAHQHEGGSGAQALGDQNHSNGQQGKAQSPVVHSVEVRCIALPLGYELCRHGGVNLQAQQVLHLRAEDGDGNTAGEARGYGVRNEFDQRAHAAHAENNEEDARHQGAQNQPRKAETTHHAGNQHHKGTCGAANLVFTATQQGDEETCHHSGDKAGGGGDGAAAAGYGKGHGEWQGYYAHG